MHYTVIQFSLCKGIASEGLFLYKKLVIQFNILQFAAFLQYPPLLNCEGLL